MSKLLEILGCQHPIIQGGQVSAFIKAIKPVKDIIAEMVS
jgi:hypothetical protein